MTHPAYANIRTIKALILERSYVIRIRGSVEFLRKEAPDTMTDVSEIGHYHRLGSIKGSLRIKVYGESLHHRRFALTHVYLAALATLAPSWNGWKLCYVVEYVHKDTYSYILIRKDPVYWPDNTYNPTSVRLRRARVVYVAFRNAVMACAK